jgi:DNA-binding Lrp family transcriptional regulator
MAFRAYILIEAEVGHAKGVADAVSVLKHPSARIATVDTVTGPFDVIVQMEADDLDKLGTAITEGLQRIEGVQRTTTCLAVRLG